jgi:hypothetical protein
VASVKKLTWDVQPFQSKLEDYQKQKLLEIVEIKPDVDYILAGDIPSTATIFTVRKI